jgi:acyl carrier protein
MTELLNILQDMHPEIDFLTHATLIDDKVLDSFDIITLAAEINDKLEVAIPAEEIVPENFNSYAALSALVARLSED